MENIEQKEHDNGNNDIHRHRLANSCNDEYRVIEVGVTTESSFCDFVNGESNVETTINSIMAGVAFEYEVDVLCFTARMSYRESFCDESSDPLRQAVQKHNAMILLLSFSMHWNKNKGSVERDLAVLISGTALQEIECPDDPGKTCKLIGMARGIGTSCTDANKQSYAINYVTFTGNVGNMVRSFTYIAL